MAVTELDQKLILVAEDDDEIRGLIKQALESENEGLNLLVVEAKDGAEAIAQAEKQEFQCVITDLKMPLASGEDLIRSLQSKAANAHTPTLVVSGHMDADFGEQYKNVRTISKPFLPNDLAKAVVREVKLGRTDERAPVHLINPFVAAVRKLMTEDLKLHTDLQAPKVKKSGDPVDGEVHCTMTMTTGPMQFRFTLSFDELWLNTMKTQYFAERNLQWSSLSQETVARQTATAIFNHAIESLIPIMGDTPRVAGITVVTMVNEAELSKLSRTPGINVTVGTDQGRIIVGAFTPGRTRRRY